VLFVVTIRSKPLSLMANYSKIKRVDGIELYGNSSGRKLKSRGMRRHRGGRKRDREAEERGSRYKGTFHT